MMVLALINCKKDDGPEPTPEQLQLEKLTATWNCTEVIKDAVIRDGHENFKLTITGTPGDETFSYSCAGRVLPSPWQASGTWKFGPTISSSLVRDAGTNMELPVSYSVTETSLELTFIFSGEGFNSRVNDIPGQWVFKFSK